MKPDNPLELEPLRQRLPFLGVVAMAVYRVCGENESVEIELYRTCSYYAKTPEDHQEIGRILRDALLKCCRLNIDKVIPPHSRFVPNSNAERPWNLLIGSGAMRKAGFATVAAALARDEAHALSHISAIQELFASS